MLKIVFTNAVVEDRGYGLNVNGKDLDEIISTALGTKVGNKAGYNSWLPKFTSNCCNVTVIIDPKPVTSYIEDDKNVYDSVEEMEENKKNEYEKKIAEADPEE